LLTRSRDSPAFFIPPPHPAHTQASKSSSNLTIATTPPQMANETDIKAQIKLRFYTGSKQPVVVLRSFQVRV